MKMTWSAKLVTYFPLRLIVPLIGLFALLLVASTVHGEPHFMSTGTDNSLNSSRSQVLSGNKQMPSVSGDENWDDRFYLPGTNPAVNAIAVSGSDVYVGGSFTKTDGGDASYIARWDRTNNRWNSLGSGVGGVVNAIAVSGSNVYVGGSFTIAGGISANHIARWDSAGNRWHTLGSGTNNGVDGDVLAIQINGANIYVGGNFTTAGGVSVNNIARWDGSRWRSLGSGVSINGEGGVVGAIAVSDSNVYVGGVFNTAGGIVGAINIAHWDGNQWHSLGAGLNGPVKAIGISGTNVYVGGLFSMAGDLAVHRIARWDGTGLRWDRFGGAIGYRDSDVVNAIAVTGSGYALEVYVGGNFNLNAPTARSTNLARWSGNIWQPMGSEPRSGVGTGDQDWANAIAISGSDVYVGGRFTSVGGMGANNVGRWNSAGGQWGGQWYQVGNNAGNGVSAPVYAIRVSGNDVYVGGRFIAAGGVTANGIARWDGSQWHPLGSGVSDGVVNDIAVSGNDVYVAGRFTRIGGMNANNVARWDGSQWHPLGSGVGEEDPNAYSLAIAVNGSDVYVGGVFKSAGGIFRSRIARWDGSQWHSLGSGLPHVVGYYVYAIVIIGSNVYVGGRFHSIDGVRVNNIARWDGSQWHPLARGVSFDDEVGGWVQGIAISGNDLYVGGGFNMASGVAANNIARWDGSRWHPLWSGTSNGLSHTVYAITTSGDDVYVGGVFTTTGEIRANNVARWDRNQWHPLGSGTSTSGCIDDWRCGSVLGLAGTAAAVYVGGNFAIAGNKPSIGFGIWHTSPQPTYTPTPSVTPCPMNFTDVPADYTFYAAIRYLYCRNVISGYGDAFHPGDSTTRGQLTKIVSLARGWTIVQPPTPHFNDVQPDNVFYPFVETAYAHGIIGGYEDNTFKPGNEVTRGQLSKIIVLAMDWALQNPQQGHFSDVPSDSAFYSFIETAYSHSIISGYDGGVFRPNDSATRGQICKIVFQAVTQ